MFTTPIKRLAHELDVGVKHDNINKNTQLNIINRDI